MTKKIGLNFEYCECGCHGHEASMGQLHFWLFNDLKNQSNSYRLHSGHGWISPLIGSFGSFKEAADIANKLAKEEFNKIKKETGFE